MPEVKTWWGIAEVMPHDTYVGRALAETGDYSPEERELLASIIPRSTGVAIVGANVGALAVPLGIVRRDLTIYACEPHSPVYQALDRNTLSAPNVIALQYWITDHEGFLVRPMVDPERLNEPYNWGAWPSALPTSATIDRLVRCMRLDRLLGPLHDGSEPRRLGAIILDVEGQEPAALRGAEALLSVDPPPIVYAEIDRPEVRAETVQVIAGFGYDEFYVHLPRLVKRDLDHEFARIASVNLLALVSKAHARVPNTPELTRLS